MNPEVAPVILEKWAYGPWGRLFRFLIQKLLLFPMVRFLTPMTVRGRDRISDLDGPVVVVANHVSHLDTPVILRALPRKIRNRLVVAAAKDYFYRGRFKGALISMALATFPFDRQDGSRDSLRDVAQILQGGWSLLIFPEGTRSPSGELGAVRSGAAVLATQLQVPILPIYVHGLARVMPKGSTAPLPGGIVVDLGSTILPVEGEPVPALRNRIEAALREMAELTPRWGTEEAS